MTTDAIATPPQWLTVAEVAALVRLSTQILRREARAGRLPHARIGGARGPIRIHDSWVRQWLEASATPVEMTRVR
ncbi:MAG: helix-turn-helix domain-containing protein [Acidobacteria bacterium]|nr:helix-turn-helix domain-containing protein [Acidobacteriota bacterium]